MRNRTISLLLAVCILVSLLPQVVVPVFATNPSGFFSENLAWTFDTGTGTLAISGSGPMENWDPLVYPRTETPWQEYQQDIKIVRIEPGVTTIGNYAFYESNLVEIDIPDSVVSIGLGALSKTPYLADESNWTGEVLFIDNCLISAKESLSGNYVVPTNTRVVAGGAFSWCVELTAVKLPDGLATIGERTFDNCYNMTDVNIPDGVASIEAEAFDSCSSLQSITIPNSVTSIGFAAFRGSGLTSVVIPDSVTSIGWSAFQYSKLSSVSISNSVTTINGRTFSDTPLTSVVIPGSVRSIGEEAFANSALASVSTSSGVRTIGTGCFQNCDKLTSVAISETVTAIGQRAFKGCTGLESIEIPGTVEEIGGNAFADCQNLSSVAIGDGVRYIGANAFSNTAYYANKDNWNGKVLFISNHLIEAEQDISGACEIREGTTSIADSAFKDCINLTAISIPEGIISISDSAFKNCSGLTEVTIPGSMKEISYMCFANCTGLAFVTLPDSISKISEQAFSGCTALDDVTIPDSVKFVYSDSFYDTAYYNNPDHWSEGVLYSGKYLLAADRDVLSGNYTIREGTRVVAGHAFQHCYEIGSVTIPESVTTICTEAFIGCRNLTDCDIPDTVSHIGSQSLYNTAMRDNEGNWTEGAFYIGNHLIEASNDISSEYSIREGTITIADRAFTHVSKLKTLVIPNSVVRIGDYACFDCQNLKDIYYCGTPENFDQIITANNNEEIINSTIHFNYDPTAPEPTEPESTEPEPTEPEPTKPVENPFNDVKESDYYYDPILWAVEKGITNGTAKDKFSPENPCTRGQIVTFLWRASGSPEPTAQDNPFTDVSPSAYYYKAVLWAVENGITTGTGKGKFSPEATCTRGQVATFLWRAQGKPAPTSSVNPFEDVDSDAYYYNAILWAVEKGVTNGTGKGKFSPENSCTRGQIVTFLYRALS